MCRILFPISCCENCPNKEACRAKQQKKNYAVHVSSAMAERAKYIEKLLAEEYQQLTRQRNAIEGIPSVLRRKFHIDDIPVFGILRLGHTISKSCLIIVKKQGGIRLYFMGISLITGISKKNSKLVTCSEYQN